MILRKEYLFDRAERIIASGGVVIVPTETFYAIAADPFNEEAVERVYRIKSRSEGKPLPLIASDIGLVKERVTGISFRTRRLIEHFWPGSLTVLVGPVAGMSPLLIGSSGKIGVRVPPWCAARVLAARLGGWITATSANSAGDEPGDRIEKIPGCVLASVDMVIDLGPTPGSKPSTVVEVKNAGLRVIREGAVGELAIRGFLDGLLGLNAITVDKSGRHP